MRAVALVALASMVALGCGGAPPPPEKPFEVPLAQTTPAEVCLATAAAKREKKANEPAQINLKHVLVKYAGAKRAPDDIKRTREQACLRAAEARDKVRGGADMDAIVAEYSDEPGAKTINGAITGATRESLQPSFADAAFALDINELSDVVETDFGFHIILRTQ